MHAGHDEHFALTCLQSLVSCYTESSMTYNETLWIETTFRVAENKRLLWMYQTISWIKKVKFDHRRPMVSDFALPFSFLLSQNVTKRLPCACKFCLRHWLWCYVVAKAINNNKPPINITLSTVCYSYDMRKKTNVWDIAQLDTIFDAYYVTELIQCLIWEKGLVHAFERIMHNWK